MWKIGLTGSIATGKSTTLKAFADLGVPVFSSDEAVHDLYRSDAVAPVGALFPGVVKAGEIDRVALSAQLLAHPEKLAALEAIVHPLVRQRAKAFFETAEAQGAQIAVADIPLLFESGHDYGLDRVGVTLAEPAIQRARALARPGMSVEKLDAILARQMPQDEKRKRADYLFNTSISIKDTQQAVAALVESLRKTPKST